MALRETEVVATDPDGLLGEPPQELRAIGDLGVGLVERLAHLECHYPGEALAERTDDQVVGAPQNVCALARARGLPGALGARREVHGFGGVLGGGGGDGGEDLPRGGIEHVEALP